MLIKLVLEAIHIFLCLLEQIPKGILNKIRKLYFSYLWRGSTKYMGLHLVN
jgi:hypothetical protein